MSKTIKVGNGKYIMDELIGKGSFGLVYKGFTLNNQLVAIEVPISEPPKGYNLWHFYSEIQFETSKKLFYELADVWGEDMLDNYKNSVINNINFLLRNACFS